jgi:hypothetical protein
MTATVSTTIEPRRVRLGLQPDGRNTLWELWEPRIRDAGNRFTRGDMTLHDYNAFIRRARLSLGLEA